MHRPKHKKRINTEIKQEQMRVMTEGQRYKQNAGGHDKEWAELGQIGDTTWGAFSKEHVEYIYQVQLKSIDSQGLGGCRTLKLHL